MNDRVTAVDFNEALQQFDEGLKDENKKTYEYIQSVKKYMAAASEELEQVRDEFKAYDQKLLDKIDYMESEKIWSNFNNYARYDDLKDLYSKTVPEINKFEDRLLQFSHDLE